MPTPLTSDAFNHLEECAQYNWDNLSQPKDITTHLTDAPADKNYTFGNSKLLTDIESDAEGLVGADVDVPLHMIARAPCQPRPLLLSYEPSQQMHFPAND